MPTSSHEAAHRIFHEHPELLTPVFEVLKVNIPAPETIEVLPADTTEIRPLERRVDCVLRIQPRHQRSPFVLAIEVQKRRDTEKERSWAYYQTHLGAKYDLPVLLLILCDNRTVAQWAAGPFVFGAGGWPAMTMRPLVLGPDNVPVITKPEEAKANMALTAFSAITHGRSKRVNAILDAMAHALGEAEPDVLNYYDELLEIGLDGSPAQAIWRDLMSTSSYFPGRGTLVEQNQLIGEARGEVRGEAKGRAADVVRMLERRGIALSEAERERVLTCQDLDTLGVWFDRAFDVETTDELFAEQPSES